MNLSEKNADYIILQYIDCTKEGSRENQATYEIKENDFAIFEFQYRMFIAKHIGKESI